MRCSRLGHFRGVQELLVAHVAFTAAEEDVRALLLLQTLATAEDMEVGIRKQGTQRSPPLCTIAEDREAIYFI